MATDLKDENEKLQGENDLLSKQLTMRDGELLECKKDLFKCTRKLRELETLQATAVSEYPAEGLRAVQARPVEGGQSLEAVEAVDVQPTSLPVERAYRTKGWTIFHQVDTLSHLSNQNATGPGRANYSQAKDHCLEAGYGGFVTADVTNDESTKWYRDFSTDQILRELDHHGDSIRRNCRVHIRPGIEMNTLVERSKPEGGSFKIEFELKEDIDAFFARGGGDNFDGSEIRDREDVQPTDYSKKKSDSSKKGGFQVTQGWTQIIGGSAYSGQPSPVGTGGIREPVGYLNRKKEIQRMGLIGWSERNSVDGYGDWWPRDQTRDPTEMLINTPVEGHSDTYISPGIDFRTLVDVRKERGFKLVFEHPDDIQAARFFELDFEERDEREESAVDVQPTSVPVERVKGKEKKSGEKLVYKLKLIPSDRRNMEGKVNGKFLNNTGKVLGIQFYYNGDLSKMAKISPGKEHITTTYHGTKWRITQGADTLEILIDPDEVQNYKEVQYVIERAEQGGGSRKKRSKRRITKKRTKRRTKRRRSKRRRTKRKRSKRRISNRRGRN